MNFDIDVASAWPGDTDWSAAVTRCGTAIAATVLELAHPRLSASIAFTSDAEVQLLNHQWRGKDQPTNVLSFAMLERAELLALAPDGPPELLGDIALALETCTREASDKGISLEHHTTHLIVHGLLHLAGYDHETSPMDARDMERLEINALATMGIADPYGDHD